MKKVKWGVLGTAGIARGCTIPGMQLANNCELTAVAGRNLDKAESFKAEFGFEKAYGNYDELINDPDVRAIYIPLPNDLHFEWTKKALMAGKNVLCEKPITPTPGEAVELFEIAGQNNVILMEAFAYLHSPAVKSIKSDLENGAIGDIIYMESEFLTSDYEASNIRLHRRHFGGSIYDLGCYCTSAILTYMDEDPEEICATASFSPDKIDILASCNMRFPKGARASFTCGMVLATEKGCRMDRLRIHGTKGDLISDIEYNQAGELSYILRIDGKETLKKVTAPHNYCLEVEQLGRCILDGERPHVSPEFSIRHSKLLARVLEAAGY